MKHYLISFIYSNDNATIVERVVSFGDSEALAIGNIIEDYLSVEMTEGLGFTCDTEATEITKEEAEVLSKYL